MTAAWMADALEAVDLGIIVVDAEGTILHCNALAGRQLREPTVLSEDAAGRLRARHPDDQRKLAAARQAACLRGERSMLRLGGDEGAFVVLAGLSAGGGACLVLLGRTACCDPLSLERYARLHGLTTAETRVLMQLASGLEPRRIAEEQGVALSTTRCHIARILVKSQRHTIRQLLGSLAALPPMSRPLRVG